MSEQCTHNCESCSSDCGERTAPESFIEKPNALSHIGKVIAVVSGKGGVGKSTVTALLARAANKAGKKVAILDADITGPSIPAAFGVYDRPLGDENGIYPPETADGIKVMSVNLLLQNTTDPVVWRGPILAGTVKQFWTDIVWGDVDYMFVDMPPGTGDVPLTVFQSLPVDGIVIVTTPQQLVSMIVEKAVNMARMMNIPVLALVENMSWLTCPCCGEKLPVFGESRAEQTAERLQIPACVSLPMEPKLTALCDAGLVSEADTSALDALAASL